MDVKDFYFDLPQELIAQDPLEDRSASRLLVLNKHTGRVTHRHFRDIKEYLKPGDCLVINDTKVIPARLFGIKKDTGAKIEVLLLKRRENDIWETLGLHFTKELLDEIEAMGVKIAHVTLHVGLGTFRPVKVDNVLDHHMHSEFYMVEESEAKKVNDTKAAGGRVICVGTTSCRTIESAAGADGTLKAGSGWTEIFIYPGYQFKILDCLITNFHLPESTLVMLVSALAGRESVLEAYQQAIKERYRFFSFGDAMFITDED